MTRGSGARDGGRHGRAVPGRKAPRARRAATRRRPRASSTRPTTRRPCTTCASLSAGRVPCSRSGGPCSGASTPTRCAVRCARSCRRRGRSGTTRSSSIWSRRSVTHHPDVQRVARGATPAGTPLRAALRPPRSLGGARPRARAARGAARVPGESQPGPPPREVRAARRESRAARGRPPSRRAPGRRRGAASPPHRVQAPSLHGRDVRRRACRAISPRSRSPRRASRGAWATCTTWTWPSGACAARARLSDEARAELLAALARERDDAPRGLRAGARRRRGRARSFSPSGPTRCGRSRRAEGRRRRRACRARRSARARSSSRRRCRRRPCRTPSACCRGAASGPR